MVLNSEDVFQIGETTFRFIEKEVLEGREQLFQTLEIISANPKNQGFSGEEGGSKSWKQQIQDTIETIPFFSVINQAERKSLMDTGTLYLFGPGESIIKEGDPGRSMYIILDGQVRLFTRDYKDEEFDLAVLGPSEFFGEISLLTGKPHLNSVAALENTVLIEFTHASMQELARENPAINKTLSEYCHDRLADLEKKRF